MRRMLWGSQENHIFQLLFKLESRIQSYLVQIFWNLAIGYFLLLEGVGHLNGDGESATIIITDVI